MARAGVVLERDGVCRNSHLSPKGHARHTRHADHATTNLQVKAPSADLSGSLPYTYPADPINMNDLDGQLGRPKGGWKAWAGRNKWNILMGAAMFVPGLGAASIAGLRLSA